MTTFTRKFFSSYAHKAIIARLTRLNAFSVVLIAIMTWFRPTSSFYTEFTFGTDGLTRWIRWLFTKVTLFTFWFSIIQCHTKTEMPRLAHFTYGSPDSIIIGCWRTWNRLYFTSFTFVSFRTKSWISIIEHSKVRSWSIISFQTDKACGTVTIGRDSSR